MEDPALNSSKFTVVFTDPDVIDSSPDESEPPRKKSKRNFDEVYLPTVKIPRRLGLFSDESLEKYFAGARKRNRDSPAKKRNWLDILRIPASVGKKHLMKARRGRWIRSEEECSPTSTLDAESSDDGSSGDSVKEGASGEGKFGYLYGLRVVDENGFLLGEFSKLDDLSICTDEDGAILDG